MKNDILKPDGVKSNYIFQFLYQAVILLIPLIVSPYLTRKLGSSSLGVYTYTYSIAYYFVIFAMLGIEKYGQRIIAQNRNDIRSLQKTFWSLYCVHFISAVIASIAYLIYILTICRNNKDIAIIQFIYVLSTCFNTTWLFYGLEKFKIIAIRNAIVKILETICIFLFVKTPDDVSIYTLIMCVSAFLGQMVMIPQIVSAIPPTKFSKSEMALHVKPLFTLFAAVIAVTLYTVFDKTLLGILGNTQEVAFYEYSDKIIKIPKTFIGIVSTVLFPRACRLAIGGNNIGLKNNFNKCLSITCIIGCGACFGIFSVSELFAKLYYGIEFLPCGEIIKSMCPLILITGIGEAVRSCYIYPLKMDSAMVKILFFNAAINLSLSATLIPSLGVYGAVLGTLVAEISGLILEILICRKYVDIKLIIKNILPYSFFGMIMSICLNMIDRYLTVESIFSLILQIFVGAIIYLTLALIYIFFFDKTLTKTFIDSFCKLKDRLIKK